MHKKITTVIPALVGGAMIMNQLPVSAIDAVDEVEDVTVDTENSTDEEVSGESTGEEGATDDSATDNEDSNTDDKVDGENTTDKNDNGTTDSGNTGGTTGGTNNGTTGETTGGESEADKEEDKPTSDENLETKSTNQKVMKVAKEAKVREGSDKSSAEVGTLKVGDFVDVYEQNATNGWSKINFEGKMAYVNTSDLQDIATLYKESKSDNVSARSGAGASYSEFGKLRKGDRVKVYQELSNGWTKIDYNGKIAFVESANLIETYQFKGEAIGDADILKEARDGSTVLGKVKKGEIVSIYAEEGSYYKIKMSNGFGYVKKSNVKVSTGTYKPQTGDANGVYLATLALSSAGLITLNRKKMKNK